MEKKTIGGFLAALRKANGLTQKQLAEKLNVSDKAISRWERDECAPDLSVIPVLAEIFGVTSDEILRGERKDPQAPVTEYTATKTEKQLARLLKSTKTKFQIRSIIAIAIAIVGILAAAICNHGFNEATIGFMVGSIFYVAAAICQIIFLILGFSAVSDEDFEGDAVTGCKKAMVQMTELTISIIVLFFTGTVPLVTLTDGLAYLGVSLDSVLEAGFGYVLLTGFLCLVVSYGINLKLGYQTMPAINTAKGKLRLRCGAILLAVLLVLFLIHGFLFTYLDENLYLLTDCRRFDTLKEFKAHLETPLDSYGNPMTLINTETESNRLETWKVYVYLSQTGETIYFDERETHRLPEPYDSSNSMAVNPESGVNEDEFSYLWLNLNVCRIDFGNGEDFLPIHTFTEQQLDAAYTRLNDFSIVYCVMYIAAISIFILIYRGKLKKIQ